MKSLSSKVPEKRSQSQRAILFPLMYMAVWCTVSGAARACINTCTCTSTADNKEEMQVGRHTADGVLHNSKCKSCKTTALPAQLPQQEF